MRIDPLDESVAVLHAESDDVLLARIHRGDEEAIAALYDRYGGLAYGLAYRIVNDRGTAEDVVQDAFMSVWRRAISFQGGRGSVRTWLLSIVHHRAIDRLRGTAGRARRDAPLDEVDRVVAVDDPWAEVQLRVQRDVLRQSMATLPTRSGARSSWLISAATPSTKSPRRWMCRSGR